MGCKVHLSNVFGHTALFADYELAEPSSGPWQGGSPAYRLLVTGLMIGQGYSEQFQLERRLLGCHPCRGRQGKIRNHTQV